MSISRFIFTVLLFTSLSCIAVAQQAAVSTHDKDLQSIVDTIPFDEMLNESPRDLYQQFSQNPFGLPSSQNEQMMSVFLKAFTADSLRDYAQQIFADNYDPEQASSVLNWFERDNMQKILKAENEFYSLEGIRKRVVNRYEMEQDPPSVERTELINTLSENMSAVEHEVEAQAILFRSIVTAFSTLSSQQSFSEPQIENFVNNFRNQARMQVGQELNNQLLLKFHGLDNQTIQSYNTFFESEAGQWFNNTRAEAMQSAYQKASERFLELVENL